jgi:hypothetical protein
MTTLEENTTIKLTPPDIPKASWLIKKCVGGVSSDEVLTTITDIDLFIEILESNLEALQTYKKVLTSRAIAEGIKEDFGAILIEVPGKQVRNPITDIDAFKTNFPNGYHMIRDQQKRDLKENYDKDMQHIEVSAIPLTLADKKMGKDLVTQYVGFKPQEVKVVVQRKHGARTELLG